MVDLTSRQNEIKEYVDDGKYFLINKPHQYGKTTTIDALARYLKDDYIVISLDFQEIGDEEFENARVFSCAFSEYFIDTLSNSGNIDLFDA